MAVVGVHQLFQAFWNMVYPIHLYFSSLFDFIKQFLLVPFAAAAAAKSLQSCPTLCDPINGSPPGSLVPGILQARTLEWVAISFSTDMSLGVCIKLAKACTSWLQEQRLESETSKARKI